MINNSETSGVSFHFNAFKAKESVNAKNFLLMTAILLTTAMPPLISADIGSMENCLLEVIKDAKNDKTIGEIRKQCSESLRQKNMNHPLIDYPKNGS